MLTSQNCFINQYLFQNLEDYTKFTMSMIKGSLINQSMMSDMTDRNMQVGRQRLFKSMAPDVQYEEFNGQMVLKNKIDEKLLAIQMKRLNDKSYIAPETNNYLYIRFLNILDYTLGTISPESPLLLIWNFVLVICIVFNLIQIPIVIFFTEKVYYTQFNSGIAYLVNFWFLFFLYADTFIIRPSICFYKKGKLITQRYSIINQYLKLEFWLNILSLISLTVYIASYNPQLIYLKLVFFLRLYNLKKIDDQIMHFLQFHIWSFTIYRLLKLLVILWYVTTVMGCIYFAIDYHYYLQNGQYRANNQLWLLNSQAGGYINIIQNYEWPIWYSFALYWSIQTASTVGYGDITPMNPPQVIYVIIVILFMTILFAFYVNAIWKIIQNLKSNLVKSSSQYKQLKKYVKGLKVQKKLKQKMLNCIYQLWQQKMHEQSEQIINEKISDQLRAQFYIQYKSTFYKQHNVFNFLFKVRQNYNIHSVMSQLVNIVKFIAVSEGKYVYEEGELYPFLCYLIKGNVKLSIKGSGFVKNVIPENSFGSEGFFRRRTMNHYALATVFCKIWRTDYQQMRDVFKKYMYLHEEYMKIEQNIIRNNNPSFINVLCWKCNKSHFLSQCYSLNCWRESLEISMSNITEQLKQAYNWQNRIGQNERRFITRSKIRSQKKIDLQRQKNEAIEQIQQKVNHFKFYYPEFNPPF